MSGLQSTSDGFLRSQYSVRENAVKNIIFKVASYAAAYIISQTFNLLAYYRRDFTTFLMFQEALTQKLFFIRSRFGKNAGPPFQIIFLLSFIFFTAVVGLFDTLLWGLDFPGYVPSSRLAQASSLRSKLLETPSYLIALSAIPPDKASLTKSLSANLYDVGMNVTLDGVVRLGTSETYTPSAQLEAAHPRILLDTDGFAVSVDSPFFMLEPNDPVAPCTPGQEVTNQQTGFRVRGWNCHIANSDVNTLMNNIPVGTPRVWWGEAGEIPGYIGPRRGDNPWFSQGQGGGTGALKQVFTVTKGLRRHTFLQTTLKASMAARRPLTIGDKDIGDLLKRGWATRDADGKIEAGQEGATDLIASRLVSAKRDSLSVSVGNYIINAAGTSVVSVAADYLTLPTSSANSSASLLSTARFSYTNITLVRSETLSPSNEPKPNVDLPCENSFFNVAFGGRVEDIRCDVDLNGSAGTGRRYTGQVDTSASLIMTRFLGGTSSNTSEKGLSEEGLQWMVRSSPMIDHYLMARALILGGVDDAVTVTTNKLEPAVSKLQLVLSIIPVVIALILLGVALMPKQKRGYYLGSFFSAVVNTLHADNAATEEEEGKPHQCQSPNVVAGVPEVTLEESDGHVYVSIGGQMLQRGNALGLASKLGSKEEGIDQPLMKMRGSYIAA